jgi:FixJ family two-component response regulator
MSDLKGRSKMEIAIGTVTPSIQRDKILLVEDDPAVRRSMQLLLQAQGFDVRAYGSGAALLADETNVGAKCFIADYRMDDLNGIAVLTRLRERGWSGPAVLITAYATSDLSGAAIAAGFDAVLEKPLRKHALVETVMRLTRANGVA